MRSHDDLQDEEKTMSPRSITAVSVAAAFASFLAPSVFAQGAMAPPKPAAEMANLKFFDGSWSCSGEGAMEPGGPMMKTDSSVKIQSGLGGFWQVGTVKVPAKGGMPAFEGMFHTTWDPAARQYVMLWVDSMGAWSQSRASGWAGDKMVYTGEGQMGDQKMAMRDTFTRKANGSLGHAGEMQVKGQWVKMMDETCRKSAAN
jgi:uncharacterized protein DUF1579